MFCDVFAGGLWQFYSVFLTSFGRFLYCFRCDGVFSSIGSKSTNPHCTWEACLWSDVLAIVRSACLKFTAGAESVRTWECTYRQEQQVQQRVELAERRLMLQLQE